MPRVKLCRLLLWHFIFDDYAHGNPEKFDIARAHADRGEKDFDGKRWSWFRPDIITTWHPYFGGDGYVPS